MKILYISGREFGLVGTPGTYLTVEGYSQVINLMVIAKPRIAQVSKIAHEQRGNFPLIDIDFDQVDAFEKLNKKISAFDPDCVCIGGVKIGKNSTAVSLAKKIRQFFPQLPLFLEVKSHLISSEDFDKKLKLELEENVQIWSGIIALNRAMAETWFGEIEVPLLEHRIVIDYYRFHVKKFSEESVKCNKFIFCGSVGKVRKFDEFIHLVHSLPSDLKERISIDVYGRGGALPDLKLLIKQLNLDRVLLFKKSIPQSELLERYEDYNAGIGWVPPDRKFNCAASLKLVEYCAAGLVPIVTSTAGHRLSAEGGRFNVRYFDPDYHSFEKEIRKAVTDGMDSRLLEENIKHAAPFDYLSVVKNDILPFYRDNLKPPQDLPESSAPIAVENNGIVINNLSLEVNYIAGKEKASLDSFLLANNVLNQWISEAKKCWKSKIYPMLKNLARRYDISSVLRFFRKRLRIINSAFKGGIATQKRFYSLQGKLSRKEQENSFLQIELRKFLNKDIEKLIEIEFEKASFQKGASILDRKLSRKEQKNNFIEIQLRQFLSKEIDRLIESEFTKKTEKFETAPVNNFSRKREAL